MKKKNGSLRKITFVTAPGVPLVEIKALESHWKEAIKDPSYTIVTNYRFGIMEFLVDDSTFLAISATDIPSKEVTTLRKKVQKALRKKNSIVFSNYSIGVTQRPLSGIVVS